MTSAEATSPVHESGEFGPSVRFVLGAYAPYPVGGFRVVFEYANLLAERGLAVSISYLAPPPHSAHRRLGAARAPLSYLRTIARVRTAPAGEWFTLDPRVDVKVVPLWKANRVAQGAEVIVATAFPTAAIVEAAARSEGGTAMFLVQHLEDWYEGATEQAVRDAWALPLHKVAISKWLVDEIASEDPEAERTSYVPNGMDLASYGVDVDPASRDPNVVAMMTSHEDWKGHRWGLEALAIARRRLPSLRVVLFGPQTQPVLDGSWVEHRGLVGTAEVRDILNRAAIFLHTSDKEGWPLPPAEAMACGAALIAADNPGVLDYAEDGRNAVVVPRRSPEAMAKALVELATDSDRRARQVAAARRDIEAYSWARAADGFQQAIAVARARA